MTDTVMMTLDQDERAFIKALNDGDEAAMIAIFVGLNGTKTIPDEPEDGSAVSDMSNTSRLDISSLEPDEKAVLEAYHSADVKTYLTAIINRHPAGTINQVVAIGQPLTPMGVKSATVADSTRVESSKIVETHAAQPTSLPTSTLARERTRARQIAPDVRFNILSLLEEWRDGVNDTACRIANERYNGDKAGIFEEDAIAGEIIAALSDYFSIQPNLNQLASEYHVNWFFDLEWDYKGKVYMALDRAGNTIATDQRGETDELDSKHEN